MAKNPKMVICRNCNNPISEKAKICPHCGAKNKKSSFGKILLFILVAIIVIWFVTLHAKKGEKIEWNSLELSSLLPEPKSNVGKIYTDSESHLIVYIYKISKSDYKDYLAQCEETGYTVESEKDDDRFTAWGTNGYKLSLSYNEHNEKLDIELEAPMEMKQFEWPTGGVGAMLPVPKSNMGNIRTESSDKFLVYVGEMSQEDYNDYVAICSQNGYSVNYEKGDTYYRAENSDGYHISLNYRGNHVISIEITEPEESDEAETQPSASAPAQESETILSAQEQATEIALSTEKTTAENFADGNDTSELVDGMHPEFKEAMDSYESFYNEYCDFMKKYAENPSDLTLLAGYADMLAKATTMDEKFDSWNEDDLNDAELKYYLEVQERVLQKLAELAE